MSTILLYSPTCCCSPTSCFHLLPLVTLPSNHFPPPPQKKMFPHLVPYQTFFSLESQFAERSREIHLKQPVIDH